MLSRQFNQLAQSPWARLVWAAVAVLALVQVAVLYRLCAGQVERARARESVAVEQRNALTDCLDYLNHSTISSCTRQGARASGSQPGALALRDLPYTRTAAPAVPAGAVPVSYVFH
jgi:hypothetical protein